MLITSSRRLHVILFYKYKLRSRYVSVGNMSFYHLYLFTRFYLWLCPCGEIGITKRCRRYSVQAQWVISKWLPVNIVILLQLQIIFYFKFYFSYSRTPQEYIYFFKVNWLHTLHFLFLQAIIILIFCVDVCLGKYSHTKSYQKF